MTTLRTALYACDSCAVVTARPDASGGDNLGRCHLVRMDKEIYHADTCQGFVRLVGCVVVWPYRDQVTHPAWKAKQGDV